MIHCRSQTRTLLLLILLFCALPLSAQVHVLDVEKDRFDAEDMVERIEEGELEKIKDGIIHEYAGPLSKAKAVVEFRKKMPKLRREALKIHRKILGLPKSYTPHCYMALTDRPASDRSGTNMSTTSREVDDQSYGFVSIYADSLVAYRVQPEKTLIHEFNHAMLREYLGPTYRKTPRWWREGIALLAAEQRERRVKVLLAGKLSTSTRSITKAANIVPALINGLGDKHDFDDYAEDVLLIEFAVKQKPSAIADMVSLIKSGMEAKEAYASVLGMTWNEALAAGMDYCRRTAHALEGGRYLPLYKDIHVIYDLYEKRKDDPESVSNDDFLKEVSRIDKRLGYDPKKAAEDIDYQHLVWTYHRCVAIGRAGKPAEAARLLIEEVRGADGLLRETTMTTWAMRQIVGFSMDAKEYDQAEEWIARIKEGLSYSKTMSSYAISKTKALKEAREAAKAKDQK